MLTRFSKLFHESALGLEYHDNLNPSLWDENDCLDPGVRNKLLTFGKAFQSFGHIPDQAVKDIWMVGGNCGYNYTPFSDIDVHVILDKGLLGGGLIVDEYLKSLKLLWSAKHHVTVRGYALEPYFQAVGEPIQSVGIFSLLNNSWVQRPSKGSYDFDNDKELHTRVEHYQKLIDHLIDTQSSVDKFEELKTKLSTLRKDGLAQGGEFSLGNLTFKSLRNSGYLDKMTKHMIDTVDSQLSLSEAFCPTARILTNPSKAAFKAKYKNSPHQSLRYLYNGITDDIHVGDGFHHDHPEMATATGEHEFNRLSRSYTSNDPQHFHYGKGYFRAGYIGTENIEHVNKHPEGIKGYVKDYNSDEQHIERK